MTGRQTDGRLDASFRRREGKKTAAQVILIGNGKDGNTTSSLKNTAQWEARLSRVHARAKYTPQDSLRYARNGF
jgi:hypothetical protein